MGQKLNLKAVSDDELLRRSSEIVGQSRRFEADLVAHIGEVDERRLYAREAAPSMFVYCTEALHLSEAEAWLRIHAARASRKHPVLLTMKVQFTASVELRDKLERLQALRRSSVPDGDLAKIIDLAVTEKLERLETRRFARTKAPRKSLAEADTTPKSRYIASPVRRAVETRDGGRCTYEDRQGRRCDKRHDLEFYHRRPFGPGGDHSPEVLCFMCRTHNALMAEQDYGKGVMARYRRGASRADH